MELLATLKEESTQQLATLRAEKLASEKSLNDQIVELQGIRASMGDAVEELSKEIESLTDQLHKADADIRTKEVRERRTSSYDSALFFVCLYWG